MPLAYCRVGSRRSPKAPFTTPSHHSLATQGRASSPAHAQSAMPSPSPNNMSSNCLPYTAPVTSSPEQEFSQCSRLRALWSCRAAMVSETVRLHTHRGNESASLAPTYGVLLVWCDTLRKACHVVSDSSLVMLYISSCNAASESHSPLSIYNTISNHLVYQKAT